MKRNKSLKISLIKVSIPIGLFVLGVIFFISYYPHLVGINDNYDKHIFIAKSLNSNEIYLISPQQNDSQKVLQAAKLSDGKWHGLVDDILKDYSNYKLLNVEEIKKLKIFNEFNYGKNEIQFKVSKPLPEKYWMDYEDIQPFLNSINSLKVIINEKYIQLIYQNAAGSGFENSIKQCYFIEGNEPVVIYSKDMTFEIFE